MDVDTIDQAEAVLDQHAPRAAVIGGTRCSCGKDVPEMNRHRAEELSRAGCLMPWPNRP